MVKWYLPMADVGTILTRSSEFFWSKSLLRESSLTSPEDSRERGGRSEGTRSFWITIVDVLAIIV